MVLFPSVPVDWFGALEPFGLSLSKPGRCLGAVRAEPVEAGARWFGGRAWVQGGSRESPGRRVTFFCFAKRKSPKKRRPPVCDPCAALRGKPASCRSRGAPQNSLRACGAPFKQLRRVRARSMGARAPMPPRKRPAAGAASRGLGSRTSNSQTATRAIASLGPFAGASATRCASQAERSDGPNGCPIRGFPSGCAEERSGQRIRARDCLSAVKRSEFERDPAGREHRRLPAAKRRDAACRVALSLVPFFRRRERKGLARRGELPASVLCESMQPFRPRAQLRHAQPERSVKTIKNIAASAC